MTIKPIATGTPTTMASELAESGTSPVKWLATGSGKRDATDAGASTAVAKAVRGRSA